METAKKLVAACVKREPKDANWLLVLDRLLVDPRRGGSIPIISDFEKILGIKTILMGFGLESDAIHSPNENFNLDIFRKGIEAVVEFHKNYKG